MLLQQIKKEIDGLHNHINQANKSLSAEIASTKDIDSIVNQIKGLRQLGEGTASLKSLVDQLVGVSIPTSTSVPSTSKGKRGRPKGSTNHTTQESKTKRTRKPKEINMISEKKEKADYTSGPAYEPHLMKAFDALGGKAKFSEAQKKMRDLMADQGLLKPADEENTGDTTRKRYIALTGVRRGHLVADGFLKMNGDEYEVTDKGRELGINGHGYTGRKPRTKKEAVTA